MEATVRIRDVQVLNIYLVGSRLWGTHEDDSDFDLVVVVADGTLSGSTVRSATTVGGCFDVQLVPESAYREGVEGSDIILAVCASLPQTHVWRERTRVLPSHRIPVLVSTAIESSSKSWARAKKDVTVRREVIRGCKGVIHAIRLRALALLLVVSRPTSALALADLRCVDKLSARLLGNALASRKECDWEASIEHGLPGRAMRALEERLVLAGKREHPDAADDGAARRHLAADAWPDLFEELIAESSPTAHDDAAVSY